MNHFLTVNDTIQVAINQEVLIQKNKTNTIPGEVQDLQKGDHDLQNDNKNSPNETTNEPNSMEIQEEQDSSIPVQIVDSNDALPNVSHKIIKQND